MSYSDLENGEYEPNNRVTVSVWPVGGEVPDGYTAQRTSDGTANYVRLDDKGQIVRGPDGSVDGITEGGFTVTNPDGSYSQYGASAQVKSFDPETGAPVFGIINNETDASVFLANYVPVSGSTTPVTSTETPVENIPSSPQV